MQRNMSGDIRWPALAVRAAVAAVAVVGLAGCGGGAAESDALTLRLPDSDGAMASCLPFEVQYLMDMSPAFAGTAVEVGEQSVVLDVDRWYAGGSAERVVLEIPDGMHQALLGVLDFREGGEYLITAAESTVNLCGFSGEVTEDMRAAFEEAFPG